MTAVARGGGPAYDVGPPPMEPAETLGFEHGGEGIPTAKTNDVHDRQKKGFASRQTSGDELTASRLTETQEIDKGPIDQTRRRAAASPGAAVLNDGENARKRGRPA